MARVIAIFGIAAALAVGAVVTRGPGAVPERTAAAAGGAPRVLELYTPWCPSCAAMTPIVEELAASCAGDGVHVEAIDVSAEENESVAARYGVRAVPTFLFIDRDGREAGRLVGAQSATELRRGLEALGDLACAGPVSVDGRAPPGKKES